jgi:MoxR-like ATPase
VEFEGTYPLPEAQLDRFLLKIEIRLPGAEDEVAIYEAAIAGRLPGWGGGAAVPAAIAPGAAALLRHASRHVHVAPDLLPYLARLAGAVRGSPHVELGVSPRGGLALLEAARAGALLAGRDFVSPDDIKAYLVPAWAHRLILTSESELEGHSARRILEEVGRAVEVPH